MTKDQAKIIEHALHTLDETIRALTEARRAVEQLLAEQQSMTARAWRRTIVAVERGGQEADSASVALTDVLGVMDDAEAAIDAEVGE